MAKDTGEYSPTKAPETAEYAEERDPAVDSRLMPGGAEPRSPTQQGMAGLDRDDVPGGAMGGSQTSDKDTATKESTSGD